jgi:hypothetical protein
VLQQIQSLLDQAVNNPVYVELLRQGYPSAKAQVIAVCPVGLWLAGSPNSKIRVAVPWSQVREVKFL